MHSGEGVVGVVFEARSGVCSAKLGAHVSGALPIIMFAFDAALLYAATPCAVIISHNKDDA